MRTGKLTAQELENIVLSRLPSLSRQVSFGPGHGLDCAAIHCPAGQVILSSDPITGASANIGSLAIHVSCNDLAAFGVVPSAIMLVLIAPVQAEADEIAHVVEQAAQTAAALKVDIVGGHTEISDAVSRFVLTTTAIGFQEGPLTHSGGARPDDYLVMTKTAALEGTSIIACDHRDSLLEILSLQELERAQRMIEKISVVPEGILAGRFGVHAMHDATEGGILGATWEMAAAAGLGLDVESGSILLDPLTIKICRHYNLDPLRLISSGSMLIATDQPAALKSTLAEAGIQSAVIGKFNNTDQRRQIDEKDVRELGEPARDELYKLI